MSERDVRDEMAATFAAVEARGYLHAREIGPPEGDGTTTPRDMTSLLTAIWTDRAGPPEACALVRDAMGRQENTQRLASGFGDAVTVAGKTGTLPFVRNEAGVATYPDGGRYAVAVFTRSESRAKSCPPVDAAIGRAGRLAVEALRRP